MEDLKKQESTVASTELVQAELDKVSGGSDPTVPSTSISISYQKIDLEYNVPSAG